MTIKKKKIILIDDDEMLCRELSLMLKEAGYQVSVFTDSEKGLKNLQNNTYDLLLLDLKMPVVSGLEIIKTIKRLCLSLKVVVITGNPISMLSNDNIPGTTDEKELASADEVLNKPFDPEVFLAKIASLL